MSSLVAFFQSLWNDPTTSDFQLCLNDHSLRVHKLVLKQSPIFAKYFQDPTSQSYMFQCDELQDKERAMASVEFAFKLVYGYSFSKLMYDNSEQVVEKAIEYLVEFQFFGVLNDVVNDLQQDMNAKVENGLEESLFSKRWMTLWRTLFRLKARCSSHQQELENLLQRIMTQWAFILKALQEPPDANDMLDAMVMELSFGELEAFLKQIPFETWNTVRVTNLLLSWMKCDVPNRSPKVGQLLNSIKHRVQCSSTHAPPLEPIIGFKCQKKPNIPPPPKQQHNPPRNLIDLIKPVTRNPLFFESDSEIEDDDDWE
ncbi:hypothetical protein C9374_014081 [Naegleria lovaniensis]|uniref:BTB domain-containing protein n=1 Tax=Naegleria lovaniensis TaxID=51637 RepID=A0AA88GW48_NAELO|nr:uncharacterized protein C9374_014081 [Naegleria lovaniensis]KAG2389521.1 hypothetical protein C9374_014081 [Naegleria lovaniensis]